MNMLAILRLICILFITTTSIVVMYIRQKLSPTHKKRIAQQTKFLWAKCFFWLCGLKLVIHNNRPNLRPPFIIVANHRSYLDIPIIYSLFPEVAFLSKSEVRSYPIIGKAAIALGTVFVERTQGKSRFEALQSLKSTVNDGISIALFPEGKTIEVGRLSSFSNGAFNLAAEANVPLISVALAYELKDNAWLDNEQLLKHFMRTFSKWRTVIHIDISKPICNTSSSALKQSTINHLTKALSLYEPDFKTEDTQNSVHQPIELDKSPK